MSTPPWGAPHTHIWTHTHNVSSMGLSQCEVAADGVCIPNKLFCVTVCVCVTSTIMGMEAVAVAA